jgi:cytochrome c-type biogenesis protein CcmH
MKPVGTLVAITLLAACVASNATAQPFTPQSASKPILTAADSLLEARTTHLASQLRCPVCQGLSIQDSPSELAQQMRSLIRTKLDSGQTEEQVRAYFLERYGERILLAPKPSGFNLLVYLAPIALLVVGAGVVIVVVRKWTSAAGQAEDARPELR